jgi:hypothetical protein
VHRLPVGGVDPMEDSAKPEFLPSRVAGFLIHVADNHVGAFLNETPRRCFADPSGTAGARGYLVL